MRPTIALLPSPLLGSVAWEPVAEALLAAGWPAVSLAPPRFYEFLTGLVDEQGLLPPWTQWWDEAELDRFVSHGRVAATGRG